MAKEKDVVVVPENTWLIHAQANALFAVSDEDSVVSVRYGVRFYQILLCELII